MDSRISVTRLADVGTFFSFFFLNLSPFVHAFTTILKRALVPFSLSLSCINNNENSQDYSTESISAMDSRLTAAVNIYYEKLVSGELGWEAYWDLPKQNFAYLVSKLTRSS